jgi:hypothetical protein
MRIRTGDIADLPAILAMGDEAVAWLVSQGNTGQWGTQPWSEDEQRVRRTTEIVEAGDVWIAEVAGEPAGRSVRSC